jgi:hypothetical protein
VSYVYLVVFLVVKSKPQSAQRNRTYKDHEGETLTEMTRNEILLHLEELVNKLDEQQNRLQSFSGEIPALETDLLLRQVRQLYEAALELEKMRTLDAPAEPAATDSIEALQDPTIAEPVTVPVSSKQTETQTALQPHDSLSEQIIVEADQRKEPAADILQVAGIKAKKKKGDVNTVFFKESPTIGDRFEDEPTVHEKIASAQPLRTVASHQQRKPISDLKKAIGLNEKFLFINHLFDGNLQVYNQAIEYLDASPSKVAAKEYIQNTLVPQFGWELQSNTCQLFMELVERRFSF